MKKALLMAAALLLAPMAVVAADYQEGVHYTVINDGPATAKPEITEFFSFYCPHCYNFAKTVVPKIIADKPDGVAFNQAHVDFIGKDMGVEMSRAFAVAHQLNVDDKIDNALFQLSMIKNKILLIVMISVLFLSLTVWMVKPSTRPRNLLW